MPLFPQFSLFSLFRCLVKPSNLISVTWYLCGYRSAVPRILVSRPFNLAVRYLRTVVPYSNLQFGNGWPRRRLATTTDRDNHLILPSFQFLTFDSRPTPTSSFPFDNYNHNPAPSAISFASIVSYSPNQTKKILTRSKELIKYLRRPPTKLIQTP